MKKKIVFDIVLTIIWIILMVYNLLGSFWHEVLGIGITLLFFVHILINYKWIFAVSKKLFQRRNIYNTIKFLLDIILLFLITFTCISGILISKDILTSLTVSDKSYEFWVFLHNWSAYLSLIVISIHIGLHWKMILGVFRKLFRIKQFNKARSIAYNLVAVCIILYGLKATASYQLPQISDEDENTAEAINTLPQGDSTLSSFKTNTSHLVKTSYSVTQQLPNDDETIDDFLSRLICTACHKRCPLSAPRCSRGVRQASQAEATYEEYFKSKQDSSSETNEQESSSSSAVDKNESSSVTETDKNDSSLKEDSSITDSSSVEDEESLEEYLGNLFCTACPKHCSLLAPRCSKGVIQEKAAEAKYYETVNQNGETSEDTLDIKVDPEASRLFTDVLPIMGMYVAGTYYTVEFITKRKKR